jgi:hypothetical protein
MIVDDLRIVPGFGGFSQCLFTIEGRQFGFSFDHRRARRIARTMSPNTFWRYVFKAMVLIPGVKCTDRNLEKIAANAGQA